MLFVVLSLCLSVCLGASGDVKMLTLAEYNQLGKYPGLQVLYFKKEIDLNTQEEELFETDPQAYDDRMLTVFYKQYSKSAHVLADYNVHMYMINCEKEKVAEYCNMKDSHHNVYIFRDGTELISISLDSMFDVDAIVSNILQIALLREVPILQSSDERKEYEQEVLGKEDVVFSFQMAIGTKQHRSFMEVAYKYKNKFRFAVTTEKPATSGLHGIPKHDEAAVWLLQCKTSQSVPCPAARYYGRMTTEELSQFLNDAMVDNKYIVTHENIDVEPFPNTKLHHLYVFYDDDSSEFVLTQSKAELQKFKGSIGMVFINVEHVKTPYQDLLGNRPLPTLGFKNIETGDVVFMPNDMEPEEFILHELESMRRGASESQSLDQEYISSDLDDPRRYLSEVEKQDDEIAQVMSQLRNKVIDDSSLLALTDKTFPVETTNRDLLITLFYLPFDAMSYAVHHAFIVASDVLREEKKSNPLSSVNCFDWTDVCQKENITSWPVIRVYRKGRSFKLHKMIVSLESILSMVSLYKLPAPVEITSVEEFKKVTAGRIPDSDLQVDVVVVGLVTNEYSKEATLIADVASELHGYMVVTMASGDLAQKIANMKGIAVPSIVLYKTKDQFQQQVFTNTNAKTSDGLVVWLRQQAISVFPELTPSNLPQIYARKQPIVIYFTDPGAGEGGSPDALKTFQLLGQLAARGEFPDVTFTWMDKSKKTTQEVMASYVGNSVKESLVTVVLQKGQVFIYADTLTDLKSIEKWLNLVVTNKIKPSSILPEGNWKPRVAPYDFVKLVEEDKAGHKERDRIGHQLQNKEEITLLKDEFDSVADAVGDEALLGDKDGFTKPDIQTTAASETVHPNVGHNEL